MAKTFEEMQSAVADWLGVRETDTVRFPPSVRRDVINAKMRDLCRRFDFRFLETNDTPTLVVETASYTLPADWSRPYTMRVQNLDGTVNDPLEFLAPEEFDSRYPNPASLPALPMYYTIWGSSLIIAPAPDAAYPLQRRYYKFLPDLANGAPNNTNDFLVQAWDVLLWECLADAAVYGIEDARIPVFQQRANEAVNRLMIEHARNRTAGRRQQSQEPG